MARVLVVYYSRTGTTKKVAEELASILSADLEEIADRTSRSGLRGYLRSAIEATFAQRADIVPGRRAPGGYDLVVFGTPTWNAAVSSPVRTYLDDHRGQIRSAAFFVTCGGRGGERVLAQMKLLMGKKTPVATLIVREGIVRHGALAPAVERFAREIAASLAPPPARPEPPPQPRSAAPAL